MTINLAGRQRMLTQRMVKSLLQIHLGEDAAVSAAAASAELNQADQLMDQVKAEGRGHWRLMEFVPGSCGLVEARG